MPILNSAKIFIKKLYKLVQWGLITTIIAKQISKCVHSKKSIPNNFVTKKEICLTEGDSRYVDNTYVESSHSSLYTLLPHNKEENTHTLDKRCRGLGLVSRLGPLSLCLGRLCGTLWRLDSLDGSILHLWSKSWVSGNKRIKSVGQQ